MEDGDYKMIVHASKGGWIRVTSQSRQRPGRMRSAPCQSFAHTAEQVASLQSCSQDEGRIQSLVSTRTSTGSPHSLASPRATPAIKIEMDIYSMYNTKHCCVEFSTT